MTPPVPTHPARSAPPRVREATRADAYRLAAIHAAAWRAAFARLVPAAELDALDPDALEPLWRGRVANPARGEVVLVVEVSGTVQGYARSHPSEDVDDVRGDDVGGADGAVPRVGTLGALDLDPAVWRQGSGAILLDAVARRRGDDGYDDATLWVLEEDGRARAFYARHEWSADGAVETVDGARGPLRKLRYRRPTAA
jgi:GNAT superfamily N-acetyltransferase